MAVRILRTVFGAEDRLAASACQGDELSPGPGGTRQSSAGTVGAGRPGPHRSPTPETRAYPLTRFQEAGVARVRRTLERRGGVLLADAVGLGKTYMALAVAEERLRAGGEVVVIVPAALRTVWSRPLARIARAAARADGWWVLSHTQLSRGAAVPDAHGPRLIIVDEAHRFRNPDTLRYRALARLTIGGHRIEHRTDLPRARPEVLLVTATPVNNALADLYHLVRLFLPDEGLSGAGVPSVRAVFDTDPSDPAGLRVLVRELVVRRSRPMVEQRYGAIRAPAPMPAPPARTTGPSEAPVRFPGRAPPRIHRYRDPAVGARVRAIASLELALYGPGAAPLMRLALLKRMDSSATAFAVSLHRLREYLDAFVEAARTGRLLRPGDRTIPGDGDPLQLPLLGIVADPAPPDIDLDDLAASALADRNTVDGLIRGLPGSGSKADALMELIASLAGHRVLVFTEYRDTAESLWRALAGHTRVARIDGSGAWLGTQRAGRRTVVERFAPTANRRTPPPERERVDVLIATDVLAEGLNLQDARHVISYDLPWNPVRLLQRIGRIDRLGSPHDQVVPHLFVPGDGLDAVLGLTRRLRTKLHGISAVLDEPQADELLQGLAAGRADRVATAMRAIEHGHVGDPWEQLRTLWLTVQPGGTPDAVTADPIPADLSIWAELRPGLSPGPGSGGDGPWPLAADHTDGRLLAVVLLGPGCGRCDETDVQLLEVTADGAVHPLGSAGADALAGGLTERCPGAPTEGADRDGTGGTDATGADPAAEVGGAEPPHTLRPILTAVARRQSVLAARRRAPRALAARDPAARLARRIRRLMAEAGAGLSPVVVRDAERVLRALAGQIPPGVEQGLARLIDLEPASRLGNEGVRACAATDLVSAALDVLRSHRVAQPGSGESTPPETTRILAVLLASRKPG